MLKPQIKFITYLFEAHFNKFLTVKIFLYTIKFIKINFKFHTKKWINIFISLLEGRSTLKV